MKKNIIDFSFSAPYFKIGSFSKRTKNLWIIFHGYGQLVEEFSTSFSDIDPEENVLIFPQGLSTFYLKGVDKKIGANWMTAQDRDLDITNYLNYLDQMYEHEAKPHLDQLKLNILGFSQGGHTASRWINHSRVSYNKLILWGSGLAHEINKEHIETAFSKGKNFCVIGDNDRFISTEQLINATKRYSTIGFDHELIEYHGKHDIYPKVLKQLI